MISSELSEKYFRYLSPIDMYKALNEITGLEENKAQVNAIGNRLASLMKKIESKQDIKKIENGNRMLEIVERISNFNQLN